MKLKEKGQIFKTKSFLSASREESMDATWHIRTTHLVYMCNCTTSIPFLKFWNILTSRPSCCTHPDPNSWHEHLDDIGFFVLSIAQPLKSLTLDIWENKSLK